MKKLNPRELWSHRKSTSPTFSENFRIFGRASIHLIKTEKFFADYEISLDAKQEKIKGKILWGFSFRIFFVLKVHHKLSAHFTGAGVKIFVTLL